MSEFLTPQQILEQKTLVWEELEVPEWHGKVRVKLLSAKERDEWEASMMTVNKNGQPVDGRSGARARLVQMAVINEDGSPLFTKRDIKVLSDLPAAGIQRIFNKVNEMSLITDEDLEEMAEGFSNAPDEPSPSD